MSDSDLLAVLASIDASLKDIAAFARFQLQQATGEKVHEIAGYVRSENAGGALVHLYSAHPGLKFRVGCVYSEHFDQLPFDPSQGRMWDGEAAPSLDTAKSKGYFVAVAPFSVSFLPTGATTDAGLPVYRFNRIVGGASRTVSTGEGAPLLQATTVQNGNGHGQKTAVAAAPGVAPSASPAPARTMAGASIIRTRPLDPDELKAWIMQEARILADHGREASKTQIGATHNALAKLIPNDESRHAFQTWLTGNASMADWPPSLTLAVHGWLKPASGNGPTDTWCGDEMALALDHLRPTGDHPVWETSADAQAWAVRMGAFADEGAAKVAFQAQYVAWGSPAKAEMFRQWEEHIDALLMETPA